MRFPLKLLRSACALACLATPLAYAHDDDDDDDDGDRRELAIEAVSNRADLVSGGDALVRVTLPRGQRADRAVLALNGKRLNAALHRAPDGNGYLALVSGMKLGENELTLSASGKKVRLELTNHPIGGPVFSGPQIQPWTCRAGALDAQCNRETTFQLVYRPTTGNAFLPYDPASPPADVMQVTTTKGVTVPYIVRVETDTMNRDGVAFAVLFDPAKPWTPWAPQAGWNGSVHILQGAGTGTGHTEQAPFSTVNPDFPIFLDPHNFLSKGFMVVQLALVNNSHNNNPVVQSEAVMMAKEYITERYGLIDFTFGQGASGGSISQLMDSNAYPGLYDGLIITASFIDSEASRYLAWHCKLIWDHFAKPGTIPFTTAQKEAVAGVFGSCDSHAAGAYQIWNPSVGTGCEVPDDQKFNAVTNPNGVRCTSQDYQVNQVGRRPDGFANTRLDNVGVQYGLKALLSAAITPAQFVEMNANAGGHDINFNRVTHRVSADLAGLPRLYRTGINNMANNLDQVAILDMRSPSTDFHQPYHTNIARARLLQANGHIDNHVLWRSMSGGLIGGDPTFTPLAFDVMVEWLTAIKADTRKKSRAQKVIDNKPALARDRCTLGDGIDQDPSVCTTPPATLLILAGQDDTMHAGKCQLKSLLRSEYLPITFTDAQWATMQQTFPSGVCDNGRPLVALRPTDPWLTYKNAVGGRRLPDAPRSHDVREKHHGKHHDDDDDDD